MKASALFKEYSTPNVHPVTIDEKKGFINRNGDMMVQPIYDSVSYYFFAGFWYVEKDGLHGCVDADGHETIKPQYEDMDCFYEDLCAVMSGGKFGFIDRTGNMVVKPQFDHIQEFREGLAPVEINGKWGYIDKKGDVIIPLEYDYADVFQGALAQVKLNGEYVYIDRTGRRVWPKAE